MIPTQNDDLAHFIRANALELGFQFAEFAPLDPPVFAGELDNWLEHGNHAEMEWLANHRDKRKHPQRLVPEAKSLLVVGMNYLQHSLPPEQLADPSRGRFAMYAWGKDYHDLLKDRLQQLTTRIENEVKHPVQHRAFVDTAPILERPVAVAAGLGWQGKNTLLLRRDFGSRFFLGSLFLDIPVQVAPSKYDGLGCGNCHRCGTHCPTGALDTPYSMDARRCISYLTIEHRGIIPREFRPLMGNWVFGCDICQNVCPQNARKMEATNEPHFAPTTLDAAAPELLDLIQIDQAEFSARFKGSAVKRTKRRGLLRNVAIALGNWGDGRAVPALVHVLAEEPEPLVRAHAAWALGQYPHSPAARRALEKARQDKDTTVAEEADFALANR